MSPVDSLRTETKFKKTEIGEIPVDWAVVQIRDISQKPEYGYTTSAIEKPVGPKFLRITDIKNGHVNWSAVPYCDCPDSIKKKYILKSGDILFTRTGATTGKSFLMQDCPEAVFVSYLIRITPTSKINSQFLNFVFNSHIYWKQIRQAISGSAQGGVNANVLSKIRIPLPPFIEQGKIVDVLGSVEEAIEKKQEIIEKTKELKKGLMQELLTRGIGQSKFKRTEIGEIPEGWEIVSIIDIINNGANSIKIGPFGSQLKREFLVKSGYKVYGQENVFKNDFALGNRRIDRSRFEMLRSFQLYPGDVVITMMGTIGKCAIIPEGIEPGIMDSHLLRLNIDEEKFSKDLLVQLISDSPTIKKQIRQLSVGGIMEGLSSSIVKKLIFPFTPIQEQKKIAKVLSAVDDNIKGEISQESKLRFVKEGLMDELLTGKKRVSI